MDLLGPLFRVHALLRLVLVALTCAVNVVRFGQLAMPVLAILGCAVMLAWSLFSSWMYLVPRRRRLWVFVLDLVVTVALVLASVWVIGPTGYAGPMSLPAYWIAGAPLAFALWRGWVWGLASSVLIAAADLAATSALGTWEWSNLAVLILACASVGYIVNRLKQSTSEREQMYAVAAAMGERQRLSRIVHDGVLQVLAMVERDGRSLGPRGSWLAHMAHEQEVALRSLLQDTAIDAGTREPIDETHANLAALLDRRSAMNVTVSTPAGALLVEAKTAREIDAAVGEALTNVARHAGTDARAWVLLEREGGDLLVSIRDNGVGADPAAFDRAASRGRMGTRHSILGRLRDLGGTATMRTAPGHGVEWEFRIPVRD